MELEHTLSEKLTLRGVQAEPEISRQKQDELKKDRDGQHHPHAARFGVASVAMDGRHQDCEGDRIDSEADERQTDHPALPLRHAEHQQHDDVENQQRRIGAFKECIQDQVWSLVAASRVSRSR